ncbi:MAG: beta-lactamase regulating signal transducer with metallopeptidase domain [Verrucomicrobiales bacterium]|jgi:beta-lactamase regulating signal transducer with metallopeptidase domain
MTPTVTNSETFLSLLVTCSLKGTMFLLLVGMVALTSSSASRRHFTWVCGFVCLGVLLLVEPFVPHWGVLPDWRAASWMETIRPWVLPIWGVGAILFCSKVLLGLLALFRIERSSSTLDRDPWDAMVDECRRDLGIKRQVHLLKFPGRIMPMTWGVLRNFVVLPSSAMRWSGQRIRAVLMHELAHIRRGDYLASLVRDAVCAFYWFHPLIWWAAREMDEDREEASDDAVIAAGQRPVSYAEHLTTIATRTWGQPSLNPQVRPKVALADKPLLMRIRSILTPWKSRHPITWGQRLQIVGALVIMLAAVILVGPRESISTGAMASTSSPGVLDLGIRAAYQPTSWGMSATAIPADPPQAVLGWSSDRETTALEASADPMDVAENAPLKNLSKSDTADAILAEERRVALENKVVEQDRLNQASSLAQTPKNGLIVLPPAEYSTAPPEESEEGPETIDIGEVMASFENVGHIGVDDFDLGRLDGSSGEVTGGFDLGFDNGQFSTASLTSVSTRKLSASSAGRLTSEKITPELPVAAQSRPDPGLVTRVGLVKAWLTGETHLAINSRRKAGAPTAKFRFEASKDLNPDSWDFSPDLFVLAQVRSVDGQHESTIVLTQSMAASPFRYLRIRSSSPSAPAGPEEGLD